MTVRTVRRGRYFIALAIGVAIWASMKGIENIGAKGKRKRRKNGDHGPKSAE